MPHGFVYDTFERQASAHWLPEYRAYLADRTPEGRFTKAKARVSELLSNVGI
jgi:5'-deoxynucleotidase YfbR-like HD superfamily hydrolase